MSLFSKELEKIISFGGTTTKNCRCCIPLILFDLLCFSLEKLRSSQNNFQTWINSKLIEDPVQYQFQVRYLLPGTGFAPRNGPILGRQKFFQHSDMKKSINEKSKTYKSLFSVLINFSTFYIFHLHHSKP